MGSAALALLFIQCDLSVAIRQAMIAKWPEFMLSLHGSNQFVGDFLLAVLIAANFAAAGSLGRFGRPLLRAEIAIRAVANCTFSIYLYHMPMLTLFVFVFGLQSWIALGATIFGIILFAQLTEGQLPAARRLLRLMTPQAIKQLPRTISA